jgi:hypothetical protein
MFYTTTNEFSITLHFRNDFMTLSCCPDYPIAIEDNGGKKFDSNPSNGIFKFTWDTESIIFQCAKYGCGRGGELTVSIKSSPEIMASLEECLEEIHLYIR